MKGMRVRGAFSLPIVDKSIVKDNRLGALFHGCLIFPFLWRMTRILLPLHLQLRSSVVTAFILTAILSLAGNESKPEPTFEEKVVTARVKAIEFLKKQQDKRGTWEGIVLSLVADMEGGVTALAALSLLEAGVPANDAAVEKALAYLVKLEPKKTYVVSVQTQVLCRVDGKKHKELIQRNADWLLEKAVKNGDKLAGWSYPANEIADGSNTHFAVVALGVAAKAGAKIDAKIWQQIRDMYVQTQQKNGWGYYAGRVSSGERATRSMTTCALLGLTIAAKHDKNAKGLDAAFEKGMSAWFETGSSTKSAAHDLFAIAELGRALDQKEFKSGQKTKDWYREGAEELIRTQQDDGSLLVRKPGLDASPILSTAFGLYFLGPPKKK
jgi:hypothetical protein